MKKNVYFICNAHIDPIWLWNLDDGFATTLSTFRVACDLLDEYDFIFCHNESILYKYIEKVDKVLFERIKEHIKNGKWRVIGGWYIQPDCNMPSGESFVRQIQVGKRYFKERFNTDVKTAINFDAFGSSFGLPQILRKTGYDSYIITRPYDYQIPQLKENEFTWEGVDGSKVKVSKVQLGYGTGGVGAIKGKFEDFVKHDYNRDMIFLWGIGNHGGGPSRQDLEYIKSIDNKDWEVKHSYPEEYFDNIDLPYTYKGGINPTMPGCYVSMIRVKQNHRKLENAIYQTEKMMASAELVANSEYNYNEINKALEDLLLCEFHDVLPGSAIKQGEEQALEHLYRGLATCSELQNQAFIALANAQETAKEGEYPIMVYNPYPYEINQRIECELILKSQNYEPDFTVIDLYDNKGNKIDCQLIKEDSSLNLDWVKRITFNAVLPPFSMVRYSGYARRIFRRPCMPIIKMPYEFDNGIIKVRIGQSGLIESLIKNGKEYINGKACTLGVYSDTEDPWGMVDPNWGNVYQQFNELGSKIGEFKLMTANELRNTMMYNKIQSPIRIIENGEIIERVESVFKYEKSYARVVYTFNRKTDDILIDINLYNLERLVCVKMEIPTTIYGEHIGDIAYGREILANNGQECVSQKWHMLSDSKYALGLINDGVYASMAKDGVLAQTLLRSPVYAAHPQFGKKTVFDEYYKDNMDLGERNFSFQLICGDVQSVNSNIDLSAQVFNEKLHALNYFPRKYADIKEQFMFLDNKKIILSAFKKKEDKDGYVIRLFNNSENNENAVLTMMNEKLELNFSNYEVKTIIYNSDLKEVYELEV